MIERNSSTPLQQAWRADTARHGNGGECPDDEAIHDAVTGTASAARRRQIIEHTAVCGACAQSWRVAAELERARPDGGVAEIPARRLRNSPFTWTLAAAAAVFAAIGVVWMLPQIDPGTPAPGDVSVLRGSDPSSFALEGPPEFRLSADPIILSWQSVEGARQYRLRIVGEELENMHVATLDATRLALPSGALAEAADGETVYWFVQAELDDGTLRRSETASAIVRRHGETAGDGS